MRRLVDAFADEAERDDGLRPGLYAADLLQRFLASTDPGQLLALEERTAELWVDGRETRVRPTVRILVPAGDPPGSAAYPRRRPRNSSRRHAGVRSI